MATITDEKLVITHDHEKKLARPVVTCKVNFTGLELCQMKACREYKMFKLKCQLWGEEKDDSWWEFRGQDDYLWTYANVYYFSDPTPTATESRSFDVTLGEGVLDEDSGRWRDEVYGKLILTNLASMVTLKKKTNTVSHRF